MSTETNEGKGTKELKLAYKDFYPVNPPFGHVGIEIVEGLESPAYVAVEPTLSDQEARTLQELKTLLIEKIDIPLSVITEDGEMEEYLRDHVGRVLKKGKEMDDELEGRLLYYLKTDFLGYGRIDLLMRDPNIEDISCNGIGIPIYVWHRNYESIPTNISYGTKEELDSFVRRLAYKAGQQISVAHPILEGTLPEGYRIHLTLDEVSKRGDTFTIRKYSASPYSIVDLINFGTVSPKIAAYLWLIVENLRSIMVCGGVASGKTTLLNAICTFMRPEMKVVTIEEVRELRLHENWIPMVTRPSFQQGVQEVTLFDLLRSALRQRPDYIVVGEVRGEEAFTLFQSMAVGHGGLCTIHADSIDAALKRLLARPMNIPKMMLSLMNVLVQVKRVKVGEKFSRRIDRISEVTGVTDTETGLRLEERFQWNPEDDTYAYIDPSFESDDILRQISRVRHLSIHDLKEELRRRERVLSWMRDAELRGYDEVANMVRGYYLDPEQVYKAAEEANQ